MEEIIDILMQRDGISYADAKQAYLECREAMLDAISSDDIFEVEDILRYELGLEPDYIFNFI